jgi:inosine-uridine nucleoside N-ribohydrolase
MIKRLLAIALTLAMTWSAAAVPPGGPVKIIFDTDIGNDVDDVLALSLLHALQSRGDCEILGVTVTIPDELAGPFVDAMNTFYSRPEIPIGCIRPQATQPPSRFLYLVDTNDNGVLRYPHKLQRGSDAPAATHLLRQLLASQPDHSVVIVQTGYFSNLGALLNTPGDDISALAGKDLVKQKVKFLSVMAGRFDAAGNQQHFVEFNVTNDIPAAQIVAMEWPTATVWSGFEIGIAACYPAISIERDFNYVPHHPAAEAYCLYKPPPHERPTWDLTAALYAVEPDRGYFDLSPPGRVVVDSDGFTHFESVSDGRDRYLILSDRKIGRLKEALVQLASQPPKQFEK